MPAATFACSSSKRADASRFRQIRQLQDWVALTLEWLRGMTKSEWNNEQATLIRKVQQFIADRLADATQHDYLYRARMQRASELLIEQPELKVSDVASAIGYHKPQYFIKLFKEQKLNRLILRVSDKLNLLHAVNNWKFV